MAKVVMKPMGRETEVKAYAEEHGVLLWELADRMGLTPERLSRKLRYRFTDEARAEAFRLIDELAKEKA